MTEAEHEPTEHTPAESARPALGRRDKPDALRPDADERADRKLLPDEDEDEDDGEGAEDGPDAPRPVPSGPGGP
jgi:hypothetical protein